MDVIYYEKIKKTLDLLLKSNVSIQDESLLHLFSYYINSNPDFKYNRTYLTDLILPFIESQNQLKEKYNLFKFIARNIAIKTPKKLDVTLVFDNLIKFIVTNSTISDSEYINLNNYRFDKIDTGNLIIKFIIGDIEDPKIIESYRLKISLNEEKVDKSKLKKEIVEKWLEFIKYNTLS
jgi:5'-deoxynucleotidase YfbR-like HD superfamily hydrolase